MARIRYTVTFPAARPGDEVTWPNTVKVYPDANTPVPLQSGQTLNESLAFSGWSESASIVFTRPAGDNDTVTVTSGAPSGTGAAAPSAPGGSVPIADPTGVVIDTTTYDNNFSGSGGKLTVAVFPADTEMIAVAVVGDEVPRFAVTGDGVSIGDGTSAGTRQLSPTTVFGEAGLDVGGPLAASNFETSDSGTILSSTFIEVQFLPSSDPAHVGQLWNDAGTVKVSAG